MTELATLARPYATAIFKQAKETSKAGKWSESLAFMSAVLSNAEMRFLIKNPKFNKEKLADLILDICKGHADKDASNFLKLLAHNKRLDLLPKIAELFEALKAEAEGYISVEVLTAFPIAREEEKKLATVLEKKLNKKIQMNVTVDKSLIGGVLVRAGDRVIDGSMRGQLQNLRKTLL